MSLGNVTIQSRDKEYVVLQWTEPKKYDAVRSFFERKCGISSEVLRIKSRDPATADQATSTCSLGSADSGGDSALQVADSAVPGESAVSAGSGRVSCLDGRDIPAPHHPLMDWPRLASTKLEQLIAVIRKRPPLLGVHSAFARRDKLGEGAYAKVYIGERDDTPVALKVYADVFKKETLDNVRAEVNVFAGIKPHKNLVALLDVEVAAPATVILVLNLFERQLSATALATSLTPEETMHIAKSLLGALSHVHYHGFVHTDVKPSNIVVKGPSLPEIPGPADVDGWTSFAGRLLQLPQHFHVCLADLGCAVAADPNLRALPSREDLRTNQRIVSFLGHPRLAFIYIFAFVMLIYARCVMSCRVVFRPMFPLLLVVHIVAV